MGRTSFSIFALSIFGLTILFLPFTAQAGSYSTVTRGERAFIVRNGVEYELHVPRPGVPIDWQTVTEMGTAFSDAFSQQMCMYTLGNYGRRPAARAAMEGVLSKSVPLVDYFVPSGYSVRAFQHSSTATTVSVLVPTSIANEIETLANSKDAILYSDYTVLFLFERKEGCFNSVYTVDYIPIGAKADINAISADMFAKIKFGADVAIMIRGMK